MPAVRDDVLDSSPADASLGARPLAYRPELDGLRALAVMAVVGFHAAPSELPGGYLGVDMFLVVSGYLISGLILAELGAGTFSFAAFYARRVRRIVPALTVMVLSVWAYARPQLLSDDFVALGKHMIGAATFTSNGLAWSETFYFGPDAISRPLLHLWSLAVEEQFYLTWPLLLVGWVRWVGRPRPIMLLLAIASLFGAVVVARTDTAMAFYAFPARAWEFLAGALLVGVPMIRPSWPRAAGRVFALAGLLLAARFGREGVTAATNLELVVVACTGLLILAGESAGGPKSWLASRPLVALGLVSYPWYLWHWPLLSIAHLLNPGGVGPAGRTVLVLGALALASATWRMLERPLLRAVSAGRVSRPQLWGGGIAALGMVGALGLGTSRGWLVTEAQIAERALFHHELNAEELELWSGPCVRTTDDPTPGYPEDCFAAPELPDARRVLLWGDSYASSLYVGMVAAETPRLALTRVTAGACPPLVGWTSSLNFRCAELNAQVMQRISETHPSVVVLVANWPAAGSPAVVVAGVERTLAALRSSASPGIVIVGPEPQWRAALPRILALDFVRHGLELPDRLVDPSNAVAVAMNTALREAAARLRVQYVDMLALQCDARGCLTALGSPVADHLVTWDDGHLTPEAARTFVPAAVLPVIRATEARSGPAAP